MAARAKKKTTTTTKKPTTVETRPARTPNLPGQRRPEVSADRAQEIARGLIGEDDRDGRVKVDTRALYAAKRPLGYNGDEYDREQVLKLTGLRNDAKLVDLGYLMLVPKGATLYECPKCPGKFLSMSSRNAHVERRHQPKSAPVMEPRQPDETETEFEAREQAFLAGVQQDEDAAIAREEAELNRIAPINFENTSASRR